MVLKKTKYSEILEDSKKRLEILKSLKPNSHVHIICVAGTLTGAIAKLLKERGFYVTGSDKAFYPPMGEVVKETLDEVYESFSKTNLEKLPDFVLIGNAAGRANEEVCEVIDKKIPYASMPEAISAFLIGDREECPSSIVLCGTHGKTTTSAACANMFEKAGRRPAYFIGGLPNDLTTSIRGISKNIPREKRVAILEGDEYDSSFFQKIAKFHFYRPDILAVTSLEFDHADIYNSVEEIEDEFIEVINNMPRGSKVFFCDTEERLVKLAGRLETKAEVLFYGKKETSPYRLLKRKAAQMRVDIAGDELELELKVSGEHNALNLLLVSAISKISGLSLDEIKKGVESFSGVRRREDQLYNKDGIILMEDFAHHPTAVKTTLEGLKERYPNKRILAVLEPRSNTSRRHFFQNAFVTSFAAADLIFILESSTDGVYSGTNGELKSLDFAKLKSDLTSTGKKTETTSDPEELSKKLLSEVREGDLVLLMSNGDFRGLREKVIEGLG